MISPVAFANQDAIVTSFVQSPNLAMSGTAGPTHPGQWLKVDIHYGTTDVVTRDHPFVDSVQFKIWIEGFDLYAKNAPPGSKGVSVALTGDVTYVNVPMNRDIYASFYVHPDVLARYSTDRGYTDFDRKFNVHVEAYVGGTLMDLIDKRKEQNAKWFEPLVQVPNLVLKQNASPFVVTDVDRYPMIKPEEKSQ